MKDKSYTKEEITKIAKSLIGKTFGEINKNQKDSDSYDKGAHGHILEEDVFNYGINSVSAPDFENVGIELKVTPYKINKNGTLAAKERMVFNIINYMKEYKHSFYDSHFWFKNKMTQIVWYLNEDGKKKDEFVITHELLFTFPMEDLVIIKNDWETIIKKIKEGKAHQLSEADTMYLGACTKGANAKSVRQQPFSSVPAKQRAFCLKTSYMTQLVRWYIGKENFEKVCPNLKDNSFEQEIELRLQHFKGKSVDELKKIFSLNTKAKSLNEILVARMLGIKGRVSNIEEFKKANIIPKTIRISEKGTIKESMSFPVFKFERIINEVWEESDLYQMFSTSKYMFVVFKEKKGQFYFDHIKFWNMPLDILDREVKETWEKTVDVIKKGMIVREIVHGKKITNFPGMTINGVCHVRPHGRNAADTYQLPKKDILTGETSYTKQCFWLNNSFILKIVGDKINEGK